MGEDNLKSFHKWKNYETILERYPIFVYPRISTGDIPDEFKNSPKIIQINAPIIELSATNIRKDISEGKNVQPMLTAEVWKYIDKMGFYR